MNLRKIAEAIDYTAPIIYEYFLNKEDLILVLIKSGFKRLGDQVLEAKNKNSKADDHLLAMWTSYWNFAIHNQEL